MTITKMAYAADYTPAWINAPLEGTIPADKVNDGEYWKNRLGIPEIAMVPAMLSIPANLRPLDENGNQPKTPIMRKLVDEDGNGSAFFPIRLDTLTQVSNKSRSGMYAPFQYLDAFNVLKRVAEVKPEYMLRVLTSGDIDHGAGFWISAAMPDYTVADELIHRTMFARTMNDGSSPTRFAGVATVPVCDNTLAAATKQAKRDRNAVTLRHIATSEEIFAQRLEETIAALQDAFGFFDWYKTQMEFLNRIPLTSEIADSLFGNVIFPMPEIEVKQNPVFVGPNGEDWSVTPQMVNAEKEPIQVIRWRDAKDTWNGILNEEIELRGANLQAAAHAATGYVQYGKRMSKTKTDMMQKRLEDNTFGDGASVKMAAINHLVEIGSR